MIRRPPRSTLFPYPTLSRSRTHDAQHNFGASVQMTRLTDGLTSGKGAPGGRHNQFTAGADRKSTRLNSTHGYISHAALCLQKKKLKTRPARQRRYGFARCVA